MAKKAKKQSKTRMSNTRKKAKNTAKRLPKKEKTAATGKSRLKLLTKSAKSKKSGTKSVKAKVYSKKKAHPSKSKQGKAVAKQTQEIPKPIKKSAALMPVATIVEVGSEVSTSLTSSVPEDVSSADDLAPHRQDPLN